MMQLTHNIIKAQDALKARYSEDEYNQIINKLKDKTGDDIEVLAYLANDKMQSPHVRLFALAAMGAA